MLFTTGCSISTTAVGIEAKNTGREGIVLRISKSRGILTILTNIEKQVKAKHVTSGSNLRDGLLQV
jgi:hypothetical protein